MCVGTRVFVNVHLLTQINSANSRTLSAPYFYSIIDATQLITENKCAAGKYPTSLTGAVMKWQESADVLPRSNVHVVVSKLKSSAQLLEDAVAEVCVRACVNVCLPHWNLLGERESGCSRSVQVYIQSCFERMQLHDDTSWHCSEWSYQALKYFATYRVATFGAHFYFLFLCSWLKRSMILILLLPNKLVHIDS